MNPSTPRYKFIDALRGVASVGVLLAHLVNNEVSGDTLKRIVPLWAREFAFNGQFGVQVFFVLSGFVIALSLTQIPLSAPRALNFALRRQLRLDPPYFAALLMLMALHAAFGRDFPDLKTLSLNLLYLHNLAGVPQILGVAWTLCLEIQFYAALVAILALDRKFGRSKTNLERGQAPFSMLAVHLVWISALVSAFLMQIGTPPQLYALGQYSWFYFAAGVLAFWSWREQAPQWTLGLVIAAMSAGALWSLTRPASFVSASFEGIETGVVTTLILFVAARRGALAKAFLGRAGEWTGRISYSLYLTHAFSIEALMFSTRAAWGETIGAQIGLILALPVAFLVAQLFHLAIERPSVKWAARLKTA